MSARDAVRMDRAEVEEFLGSQVKVQVASLGKDGAPHLATLFYVVEDGRIAFWTYARSQKVRNLERDPRVSCLVEDGLDYFELRGVSVRGRAEILRDPKKPVVLSPPVPVADEPTPPEPSTVPTGKVPPLPFPVPPSPPPSAFESPEPLQPTSATNRHPPSPSTPYFVFTIDPFFHVQCVSM